MRKARLADLSFQPLNVELHVPFGIATGAQHVAENVLVRLELEDGTIGWGEAAPFFAVSGETQEQVLSLLASLPQELERINLADYKEASEICHAVLKDAPCAVASVETALLDALCKRANRSLLAFFGGARMTLHTDITVVTGTIDDASNAARRAVSEGFFELKVKVGGTSVEEDVARLQAIAHVAPQASLLLDANCGYSVEQALTLLRELGAAKERVLVFEQPVEREDLKGLAEVQRLGKVPVAADESLRSPADLERLIKFGGVSAVNIKTAKLGLVRSHEILLSAQQAGLCLMVGGMVETELSMSASACLAAGVGNVRHIDLDTPLFMKERPLRGGYRQRGPLLDLSPIKLGHGVEFVASPIMPHLTRNSK